MARARVGVIGAGWWATTAHIPSLRTYEKADLVGIADPNPDKLAAAAAYYEVAGAFRDYHDLLERVDGVVIAVPHAYHYQIARDALEAGAHVLVEKPMVLKSSHAWDLVRRAEQKGLELMVGTTFQFTEQAHRVREIVRSGAIGDLLHVSGLFASMVENFLRKPSRGVQADVRVPGDGPGAQLVL